MAEITILTEAELRRLMPLDHAAISCVEDAFRALATRTVVMPPILRLDIAEANGEVDVKTAYVPGLENFAVKISPGFFDNPKLGLPSVNGLMVLLSATTGILQAALFDNGYLTDLRTAAAGAVAALHLSRPQSENVAILGAGAQARLQLKALTLVRPIRRARLWARDAEKAASAARALSDELELPVVPAISALEAVKGADIVVTTTPATSPILMAGWLEPGQHVTAMGSDAGHKNEVEPAAFARLDLYVADRLSQTRLLGELHHALDAGTVGSEAGFAELGAVVAGKAAGRPGLNAITLCDLTGTGVQDTAIANLALARAREQGVGSRFSS
jgi:ornithine cyclodeaminase